MSYPPPSTPHPQRASVDIETPSGRAKLELDYERPRPGRVNILAPDPRSLSAPTKFTTKRLLSELLDVSIPDIVFKPKNQV